MGRAPCCDKANVKKGPWSPEEDTKLKSYIEKFGTGGNWIALPQKIGLKRCGKSCRLRWLNYLRPNIKHGGFTDEEDSIILNLYISIGSRWSIIAAQLPGRTDNDIKNYWNTKLKKKLLGRRKQANKISAGFTDPSLLRDGVDEQDPITSSYTPTLSSSAVERLQLHMQLQNPLSFYNNPALWPKLHPLQEKMIRNIQTSSSSSSIDLPPADSSINRAFSDQKNSFPTLPGNSHSSGLYDQYKSKLGGVDLQIEEMENSSFNGSISSEEGSMAAPLNPSSYHQIQQASDFATDELNNLLTNNNEFDCYKTTQDTAKDGMMSTMTTTTNWWSPNNVVDQGSSNCWDSFPAANCLQPSPDNVFGQDYPLGYSM